MQPVVRMLQCGKGHTTSRKARQLKLFIMHLFVHLRLNLESVYKDTLGIFTPTNFTDQSYQHSHMIQLATWICFWVRSVKCSGSMESRMITDQSVLSRIQIPDRHFQCRVTNPPWMEMFSTSRTLIDVLRRTRKPNVFKDGVVPVNLGRRISGFSNQIVPISPRLGDWILILGPRSSRPSLWAWGKSSMKIAGTSSSLWTIYSIIPPGQTGIPSSMVTILLSDRTGGVGCVRGYLIIWSMLIRTRMVRPVPPHQNVEYTRRGSVVRCQKDR